MLQQPVDLQGLQTLQDGYVVHSVCTKGADEYK